MISLLSHELLSLDKLCRMSRGPDALAAVLRPLPDGQEFGLAPVRIKHAAADSMYVVDVWAMAPNTSTMALHGLRLDGRLLI